MHHAIVPLPKERWKGHPIPLNYWSNAYYDVEYRRSDEGFAFALVLKQRETPLWKVEEEGEGCDFPASLYPDWWEKAQAWGVVRDGELLALIETCPEEWSNRQQVTELWVAEELRGQGVGRALMQIAKDQTVREKRRALMLETQTCNVNAIGFYLHEGFMPIGLDTCCYTNRDIARREVRLNMAWFPPETAE